MNLVRAILCAVVLLGSALAQPSSVSGIVTVEDHGKQVQNKSGAVIWLTSLDHSLPPKATDHVYRLAQKDKHFEPHLLVVTRGSLVEFPNHDPFFHNVFSMHDGVRFDLGLYERGAAKTVRFTKPGASYIFCNIHPEMSAVIMVMNTSLYAVTDRNGNYEITGVPPGQYQLSVWYERALPEQLKELSRKVVVGSSPVTEAALTLQQTPGIAEHHKNKFGMEYESQSDYKTP